MSVTSFAKWCGPGGMKEFIFNQTECNAFSGVGIGIRKKEQTAILRSVDDTYFYANDMTDSSNIKYTLFGHNGDQSEYEKRFNEPLLNKNKIEHIYLYRVKGQGKKKEWIWYGKYKIVDKNTKKNIGRDNIMRNVIVLSLKKSAFE